VNDNNFGDCILHNLPWYEIVVQKKQLVNTITYKTIYEMQRPISEASLIGLIDLGFQKL
jgi:hypothetical protein